MDTGNIGIRKIVIPVGGVVVGGDAERHGIAGGGNQGVGQSQLRGIVADVPGTCPACGDGLVSIVSLQTNIIAILHDEHGTACICKGVIGSAGVVCARNPVGAYGVIASVRLLIVGSVYQLQTALEISQSMYFPVEPVE